MFLLKIVLNCFFFSNFKFPPPTIATDDKTAEEIRNRERQVSHCQSIISTLLLCKFEQNFHGNYLKY